MLTMDICTVQYRFGSLFFCILHLFVEVLAMLSDIHRELHIQVRVKS